MRLYQLSVVIIILAVCVMIFAATAHCQPQQQFQSQVLNNSGDSVIVANNISATQASFGYVIQGQPSTLTMTVQGCDSSNSCSTIDTYSSTFNTTRKPTLSSTYAYFSVSGTWTGGTNVQVTVNSTLTVPSSSSGTTSPLTTKGDLYAFSSVNTRLPVGTNGQCLTAQSAQTTGLLWASCGTGGSTPTGTGFVHVTGGVQDGASQLVSLTADTIANQGTTITVLHGNAAGQPAFGAVVLTTDVSGILPTTNGGTASAFFTVAGPAASAKTFTFPNASATVLTDNAAVTVAQGGTGLASGTSGGVLGFTASGTLASSAAPAINTLMLWGGAGATPKGSVSLTTDGIANLNLGSTGVGGTLTIFGSTSGSNTLSAPGNGTQLNVTATTLNFTNPSTITAVANTLTLVGGTITQKAIAGSTTSYAGLDFLPSNSFTATTTTQIHLQSRGTFAPTSGTAAFVGIISNPTINQTGGANGIVRVLASYPVNTALVGTEFLLAAGTSSATGPTGTLTDKFTVDQNGNTVLQGSLKIGNGSAITKVLSGNATLDFGNLAAIGCEDLTITVTGAVSGDTVAVGVPNGSVVANGFYSGWVSSNDTVSVRFCTVVSGDPASGTFEATVLQN